MKKYLTLSLLCLLFSAALLGQGVSKVFAEDQTNTGTDAVTSASTTTTTTETTATPAPAPEPAKPAVDVVTTASLVNKPEAFINAISEKGTWIIATLNDLKFDNELVVAGEFHDKGDVKNAVYRKIAPYTQDDKHNVIDRFTITAPRLTIKSTNTKLQGGTFVGDVYVQANGFTIQDAKVQGNVYFTKEEYKKSFNMSNKGVVTGVTEMRVAVDTVASASLVNKEDAFINAISAKGTWIIATLNDLKINQELVLAGEFHDKGDAKNALYRKIGLYTQDEKHNVIDRFTLTAPKLIVKSPNAKIQGGTFVGDVYVEANGFTIQDAKVQGNVYFTKEEYKKSFNMSNKGVVTGAIELRLPVDTVASASLVNKEDAFINAISAKGTWIIATLNDLKINQELVLAGEFHDKGDAKNALYRKIALYTQDEKHNVIDRFTLTAPKLTIKSPNAKIQGGTFIGDVYVEANGFTIQDAKVQGNVYFTNEEYKKSFNMSNKGVVTGAIELRIPVDTVASASLVSKEGMFIHAIGENGTWIIALLNDLTTNKELVLAGEFHDKDNVKNALYRKIALYTQDAKHNVIDRFTLKAPKLTIKSPNAKIQGGTFIGDIYVEANGFTLQDAKVQGNIYFAKEEYKKSFNMSNKGVVTGTIAVK